MALGVYCAGRRGGQCGGAVAFAGGTKELGTMDDSALGLFDKLFPTAPMTGSRFPLRKSGPPERKRSLDRVLLAEWFDTCRWTKQSRWHI